jgi:pimeloyl-ACP methyl ester carboxylesterase
LTLNVLVHKIKPRMSESKQLRETYVEADGARLRCFVSGAGAPILFIHGGEQCAAYFGAVHAARWAGRKVITYDRRGYGGSADARASDSARFVVQNASDAAAVIEQIAREPAAVFGTSSGAVIAIELAIRRPDLVRALLLHEPAWLDRFPEVAAQIRATVMGANGDTRPPSYRARYVPADSDYWKRNEFEPIVRHEFDSKAIAAVPEATHVLAGEASPALHQALFAYMAWKLSAPLRAVPGGHEPLFDSATTPGFLSAVDRCLVELA